MKDRKQEKLFFHLLQTHVVAAFEHSLSDLTSRLELLTKEAENKVPFKPSCLQPIYGPLSPWIGSRALGDEEDHSTLEGVFLIRR